MVQVRSTEYSQMYPKQISKLTVKFNLMSLNCWLSKPFLFEIRLIFIVADSMIAQAMIEHKMFKPPKVKEIMTYFLSCPSFLEYRAL